MRKYTPAIGGVWCDVHSLAGLCFAVAQGTRSRFRNRS